MNWRTDFENADKDWLILIFDGTWIYLCSWDDDFGMWSDAHEYVPINHPEKWLPVQRLPEGDKHGYL